MAVAKHELLNYVTTGRQAVDLPSRAALGAVSHGVSDNAVADRMAVLLRRRKTLTRLNGALFGLGCSVLVWVCLFRDEDAGDKAAWCFGTLVAGCVLLWLCETLGSALGRLGQLFWFDPIAGTSLCQSGLNRVHESDWARQWRDLALQERSELRRFDIAIMSALAKEEKARHNADAWKNKVADACRELHAVPVPSES